MMSCLWRRPVRAGADRISRSSPFCFTTSKRRIGKVRRSWMLPVSSSQTRSVSSPEGTKRKRSRGRQGSSRSRS
nr:MAG TPA: hypothetical protein [Caudoviricetes sp.]